jgi:hypothetical protein
LVNYDEALLYHKVALSELENEINDNDKDEINII